MTILARRKALRWEQTRRDAILRRSGTDGRRHPLLFAIENSFLFMAASSSQVIVLVGSPLVDGREMLLAAQRLNTPSLPLQFHFGNLSRGTTSLTKGAHLSIRKRLSQDHFFASV